MGKVDTDNGFTRIANELLEVIPKAGLNGNQHNILWVVFRYTYGFQRKEHELSLTFIAKAIGSHKVVIQREVKKLIDMKILIEKSAPTFNQSRILAFNKDYASWELTNQLTVNQIDNHTVNQLVTKTVNQSVNQERKKDNLKEIYSDSIKKIVSLYPGKKIKATRDKKLPNILKEYGEEEIIRATKRYASEVSGVEKQFILNESTFWNGRYLDYLDENYQPLQEEQPKKYTIGSDRLL